MTTERADSQRTPRSASSAEEDQGGPVTEPIPRVELPDGNAGEPGAGVADPADPEEQAREAAARTRSEARRERLRQEQAEGQQPAASARRMLPRIPLRGGELVALIREFFHMSKSSAVLVVAFLLVLLLYSWVRDEPVIGRSPAPEPAVTSELPPEPAPTEDPVTATEPSATESAATEPSATGPAATESAPTTTAATGSPETSTATTVPTGSGQGRMQGTESRGTSAPAAGESAAANDGSRPSAAADADPDAVGEAGP